MAKVNPIWARRKSIESIAARVVQSSMTAPISKGMGRMVRNSPNSVVGAIKPRVIGDDRSRGSRARCAAKGEGIEAARGFTGPPDLTMISPASG